MAEPRPPEHVLPEKRDDFEQRHGLTYCRRCGRPVVNDRYPDETPKPCQDVKIVFK